MTTTDTFTIARDAVLSMISPDRNHTASDIMDVTLAVSGQILALVADLDGGTLTAREAEYWNLARIFLRNAADSIDAMLDHTTKPST